MIDAGQRETDALVEKMEKEVASVYGRAVRESEEKLENFLKKFEEQDKAKKALLEKGKITEAEYEKWRKNKMASGKHFSEMLDTLATDYTHTDQIAMSIVNGYTPEAYAINRNYAAFEVEKGSLMDTSFTLYDRNTVQRLIKDKSVMLPKPRVDIPKDKRWNRQHIRNEITQGILQGESIPKIAKRLQTVSDMDKAAAIRNARTAVTGAQNLGRIDSYKQARDMGIDVMQEWRATLDFVTRDSHRALDGERVNVGEQFSNGLEYPGDPSGDPSEVYNCRCCLVGYLTGFNFAEGERRSELGGMSYEEWKNEHKKNPHRSELFNLRYSDALEKMDSDTRRAIESIVYKNKESMTNAEYWAAVSEGKISDNALNVALSNAKEIANEKALHNEGLELYRTFIEGGSSDIHSYAGYDMFGGYNPNTINEDKLKALDSIFSPNQEKITVYKGMSMSDNDIERLNGITRVSRSYSSTSTTLSTAKDYADRAYDLEDVTPVIEKITVEKGVPIADAQKLLGSGGMKAYESEITIGRGVEWVYSEFESHVDKFGDEYYTVDVLIRKKRGK